MTGGLVESCLRVSLLGLYRVLPSWSSGEPCSRRRGEPTPGMTSLTPLYTLTTSLNTLRYTLAPLPQEIVSISFTYCTLVISTKNSALFS